MVSNLIERIHSRESLSVGDNLIPFPIFFIPCAHQTHSFVCVQSRGKEREGEGEDWKREGQRERERERERERREREIGREGGRV